MCGQSLAAIKTVSKDALGELRTMLSALRQDGDEAPRSPPPTSATTYAQRRSRNVADRPMRPVSFLATVAFMAAETPILASRRAV